ncbi:hypothetical protein J3R30DRAFT_6016 [Lentinula aciculospora]|uniref:Uncharacterized protein n=1 Tax=Lentinula aciculospora TaxID=153920 RepID=A0A9W9AVB5_9AGAR|nr:hypothetical protein J3R30DRAFT_6016 [Lentinula aciculospora]
MHDIITFFHLRLDRILLFSSLSVLKPMSNAISQIAVHSSAPASSALQGASLKATTEAFLRWRDSEVALALRDMQANNERERSNRIYLQNQLQLSEQNLRACEKHLNWVQKNDHEGKVKFDTTKAKVDLERLQQVEKKMEMITNALKKIGICLCEDTGAVVCLQLICDVDADLRWVQVLRKYSTEYEKRVCHDHPLDELFCTPTSQTATHGKQPLDAIAAIDTLLDVYDKQIAEKRILNTRCDKAEGEVAQLNKEIETKDSRIAELEVMVASLKGEEFCSATGTCINPSQLLKNLNFSPNLSDASSSTNPFQSSTAFDDTSEASCSSPLYTGDHQSSENTSVSRIQQSRKPPSPGTGTVGSSTWTWYHHFAES